MKRISSKFKKLSDAVENRLSSTPELGSKAEDRISQKFDKQRTLETHTFVREILDTLKPFTSKIPTVIKTDFHLTNDGRNVAYYKITILPSGDSLRVTVIRENEPDAEILFTRKWFKPAGIEHIMSQRAITELNNQDNQYITSFFGWDETVDLFTKYQKEIIEEFVELMNDHNTTNS